MRKAKRKFTVDKRVRRKYPLFAFLAVLLLLAAGAFFLLRDTDDSKKSQNTTHQNDQQSDTPQPASDSKAPTPTPGDSSGDPKDQATPTPSGQPPTKPFGDGFVSNHQPSLSGGPWELNRMSSVCNTSPGASCKISFTKGGETKSLSAQKADKEGATYWSWTLQEIGLTEGVWKITATATLNGQTSSASDPINLEVKP